ncbi:MAG: V-type ATP synthase subunit C [Firmicutes bacterium]|nr:V-type ATP synthase subunit C [Bacillota bacterium]
MAKEKIYPYAVARIRMLERFLLTEKSYIQMAEAKNIDDVLKILSEAGYGAADQLTVKNYEAALADRLEKAYGSVAELVDGQNFMDVFLLKNDYQNIKVLMKEELSGVKGENYIVDGGTVKAAEIQAAFNKKNYDSLPSNMAKAIEEAYDAYSKTMSGQSIDIVLDRAAFGDMIKRAGESGIDFIKKYMELTCDVTNLKSFMRVRNMKKPFDMFAEVYVEGGSMSLEFFRQGFGAESAASAFKGSSYSALAEGMSEGFTAFEKKCDNFIMAYIREAKYKSLTIEPLVAYIYAVETEVKTVRIILNSKINDIDSEIIKERLRDAYV